MNKFEVAILLFFATIIICFAIFLPLCRTVMEKTYFEGQRDALTGDVRLDINTCVWIHSPWNNGSYPSFNPTSLHCK